MKTKITFLVLLACLGVNCQTLQWVSPMLGAGGGTGRKIAVDGSGNVYAIGQFSTTVDFDPGAGTYTLAAVNGFDAFVTKQDASGNLLWAQRFGGVGTDDGSAIAVDAVGDIYSYQSLSSSGNRLVKLSSVNGSTVWSKPTGGGVNCITIDASGNIYLGGAFGGTPDLDPGAGTYTIASAGSNDGFVTKLDASGNFVWARGFGGSNSETVLSLAVDNSGNVFTTGQFNATADFDPGAGTFTLTSAGSGDVFVQKLNSSGNFVWAVRTGGSFNEYGYSITTDASGNCYSAGQFADLSSVDFDPGPGTYTLSGLNHGYVWKLDPSGSFVFARDIGGPAINIARDGSGNIYTTGSIPPVAYDFDPGPGTYTLMSSGGNDPFISQLDASGNFVFAGMIGGPNNDAAFHMVSDAAGSLYLTGYFNGTADFDPTSAVASYTAPGTSLGYIFTMKLNMTATGINEMNKLAADFIVYPNPASGHFSVKLDENTESAQLTIMDAIGKEVLKTEIKGTQPIEIELENKGFYFVRLETKEGRLTKKLVIE